MLYFSLKRTSDHVTDITGPVSFPQYIATDDYKKCQNGELSMAEGSVLLVIEKKHTGTSASIFTTASILTTLLNRRRYR